MIIVRGVNIYPSAIEEIIRGLAEVAEYRVHVSTKQALTEMRVEIEPVAGAAAAGIGDPVGAIVPQSLRLARAGECGCGGYLAAVRDEGDALGEGLSLSKPYHRSGVSAERLILFPCNASELAALCRDAATEF